MVFSPYFSTYLGNTKRENSKSDFIRGGTVDLCQPPTNKYTFFKRIKIYNRVSKEIYYSIDYQPITHFQSLEVEVKEKE